MDVATVPVAKPDALGSIRPLVGRCFSHPLVDYFFVGGAITVPIFVALYFFPGLTGANADTTLRTFIFLNGAHFAASTVRLYTKPGARRDFPFLSFGFPVVCLTAVWAGLEWPGIGRNLSALYFSWSPYHYAAQTYGLAVMYAMRSGARLDNRDKAQMWWVCLVPFLYALITAKEGGLAWFVSREWLATIPALWLTYRALVAALTVAVFLLPVSLFWQLHRMRGRNVPLISLVLQITNGLWWLGTDYINAWYWTAMLHSTQYLIIVVTRHVQEQMARTDAKPKLHKPFVYGSIFYGVSFVLGIVLFFIVPLVYVPFGFTATQSFMMMTVVINLHHFIVDGFIWRTRPPGAKPAPTSGLRPVPAVG
ncbi:MAG TPA: hypothetical protein VL309_03630 [Vicinamibacterales bacterium]|jgi:hypothetical protein|nr:hypothetical protein [Vicinamibacterales bacterium]